jgi:transcriptional regulator with XRE-family HTH domain
MKIHSFTAIDPYNLFKNIKQFRILSGLTQKQLAEKIGVSSKTISAYETGRALPPLPILVRIAEITNVNLESLIKKEDEGLSPSQKEKIKKLEERVTNLEQLIIKILKKSKF